MELERLRDHCLAKPGASEDFPFGPDTLVIRVVEKLFFLTTLDAFPPRFNAKCDPARAVELRDRHDAIVPGYHMSKKHWNTVLLDGTLPDSLILELVDHSYELVAAGLPKKTRIELGLG